MAGKLQGKVAVVTGSGQNIGRAIAIEMAREGAQVVTNSRRPDNPEGTAAGVADEITNAGGSAVAVFADVSMMDGAKQIIDTALAHFGTVDILVNNAGYGTRGMLWEITEQQWDEIIDVCLKGHFACSKYAAMVMKEKGRGRIINVSSRVGLHGLVGMTQYAAAKAGILGLTWSLAQELAPYGITVNCMVPTATTPKVEQARRFRAEKTGVYYPPSSSRLPEHVAPIVTYLACDDASGISGQVFYASGGEITLYSNPAPLRSIYKQGKWTMEELSTIVPTAFGRELRVAPTPAPPP